MQHRVSYTYKLMHDLPCDCKVRYVLSSNATMAITSLGLMLTMIDFGNCECMGVSTLLLNTGLCE